MDALGAGSLRTAEFFTPDNDFTLLPQSAGLASLTSLVRGGGRAVRV